VGGLQPRLGCGLMAGPSFSSVSWIASEIKTTVSQDSLQLSWPNSSWNAHNTNQAPKRWPICRLPRLRAGFWMVILSAVLS